MSTTETAVETTVVAETTPVVAKAPKAPKAKKGKVAEVLETVLAFEPGILTLKLDDIDTRAEANITRSDVGIDPKHVELLAASLKVSPQQVPITVQRTTGEFAPYRIVSGYHRCAALRSIGRTTVEARVLLDSSDRARVLGNVDENLSARKDVTALGAAVGVEALVAEGFSMADIAERLGKAEDYVRDLARISKGADEVRTALQLGDDHENGVTWAVARLVLRFPKGEQAALLRRVQKLSVVKAREVLAACRAEKSGKATSETDKGEGKESRDSSSSKTGEHDAILPEAKVVKATVGFVGTYGLLIGGIREALANGDLAQAEKIVNQMAKTNGKHETALRSLLTDKVFETAEKAIAKAAKEAAAKAE